MSEHKREDATLAMREAFEAAEQVAMLMDRHWGDAGDDADMIEEWRYTLERLAAQIKREIGEPRMRLSGGGLVPRPRT
jgi:hypothetical protein